ncbi:hypothetical protein BU24DRAFT_457980 [Aaosphaeria arxii CBS 175.79]|uniref:Uncharacterized protein n=1 Tax=Aaosphaeria arxii CBS 175.79 TaxID=1450172 RepID=A0A6A5Y923_9PLEO|nr:uncharacterized protein BU24DRAFT_457980 [Aaosphaeria arxii CBS 175.79]KAF2022085.1 hypothetical protein BU24DRAFT_457980 [Aaosphaeria arxii CBS 175.79]
MPLAPLKSLQLTLRLLSLAGTHATFLTTLYLTLHPIPFTTLPADNAALLYISLAVLLVLDNAEILALTATPGDGIKRLALYPLVACEAVALVLPMVAAFVEFFVPGDDDYGIGRRADGYGWRREVGRVRWGCVGGVM